MQDENDLCDPIVFLSALTASFPLPFVSSITLVSRSRTAPNRHYRYHAVAVSPSFYLVLLLPLCTYISSIQSSSPAPRGRRYDTQLKHS
jgi:hypothetical protein